MATTFEKLISLVAYDNTYHGDIRDRMMGRAKRTLYHQGGATSYLTGYGMDFSCFQGLTQGKKKESSGENCC